MNGAESIIDSWQGKVFFVFCMLFILLVALVSIRGILIVNRQNEQPERINRPSKVKSKT